MARHSKSGAGTWTWRPVVIWELAAGPTGHRSSSISFRHLSSSSVAWGSLGTCKSGQLSGKFGRTRPVCDRARPDFGQSWPGLVQIRAISAEIDRHMLTSCGWVWVTSAMLVPSSTKFGPIPAKSGPRSTICVPMPVKLGRARATLRRTPAELRRAKTKLVILLPYFDQHRPNPGRNWPNSGRFRPNSPKCGMVRQFAGLTPGGVA